MSLRHLEVVDKLWRVILRDRDDRQRFQILVADRVTGGEVSGENPACALHKDRVGRGDAQNKTIRR